MRRPTAPLQSFSGWTDKSGNFSAARRPDVFEFYDEESDELVVEDRIEVDGEEYRVLDDGVEYVETG